MVIAARPSKWQSQACPGNKRTLSGLYTNHIYIYTCTYIYLHIYICTHAYICEYTYIYTYICIYICIYIYTHMHNYMNVYIYVYMSIHICIYKHIYIYTCKIHICIHIYIYIYIFMNLCVHIFMYLCKYTYIYMCIRPKMEILHSGRRRTGRLPTIFFLRSDNIFFFHFFLTPDLTRHFHVEIGPLFHPFLRSDIIFNQIGLLVSLSSSHLPTFFHFF